MNKILVVLIMLALAGCAAETRVAPEWMQPGYRISEYNRGYNDGYRDAMRKD